MGARKNGIVVHVKRRRRKWPWVVLGLVVFFIIVGALSDGNNDKKRATSPSATATTSAMPLSGPTPQYSVIGQLPWRRDGKPTYYVVIDPVDLSNDGFKLAVKLVTQAIARMDGAADFSAKFYDDQTVANVAFTTDPGSGNRGTKPPLDKAALDERGQHLVAIYSGGLEMQPSPYQMMWYPGAFTVTPNVGRWVSNEDWKPAL